VPPFREAWFLNKEANNTFSVKLISDLPGPLYLGGDEAANAPLLVGSTSDQRALWYVDPLPNNQYYFSLRTTGGASKYLVMDDHKIYLSDKPYSGWIFQSLTQLSGMTRDPNAPM
jgi:hypothetical protein